ncbi:hypothetical protein DM01DRAFT_1409646 [Hesseltinella vesiculosa]|uniref:Uncharacterized protein n=1 Tax=Hesseltinella vesiculosa TaxID=101127 RepID=A0A1X2GBR4_9FUNG|nr:hypothetical protein DM01DRAFT_1409646 [Hesseltinella vesiculosa]
MRVSCWLAIFATIQATFAAPLIDWSFEKKALHKSYDDHQQRRVRLDTNKNDLNDITFAVVQSKSAEQADKKDTKPLAELVPSHIPVLFMQPEACADQTRGTMTRADLVALTAHQPDQPKDLSWLVLQFDDASGQWTRTKMTTDKAQLTVESPAGNDLDDQVQVLLAIPAIANPTEEQYVPMDQHQTKRQADVSCPSPTGNLYHLSVLPWSAPAPKKITAEDAFMHIITSDILF